MGNDKGGGGTKASKSVRQKKHIFENFEVLEYPYRHQMMTPTHAKAAGVQKKSNFREALRGTEQPPEETALPLTLGMHVPVI